MAKQDGGRKAAKTKAPAAKRTAPAAKATARGKPRSAPVPLPAAAKTAGRTRRAQLKTRETDASVQAFLDRIADPVRRAECQQLNALLAAATGAPPKLWGAGMVGFGQYHYRYDSGREGDWMLAGYSPRKAELSIYVMAGLEHFPDLLARLGRVRTGKSCLYVKSLAGIDLDVLRALVEASCAHLRKTYG
jgi:hypothetical protein